MRRFKSESGRAKIGILALLLALSLGGLTGNDAEASFIPVAGEFKKVTSAVTLTVDNTTGSDAAFTLTGSVEVYLWGEVTTSDGSMVITAFYLDLWDATSALALTDNVGIDLSNLAAGTMFFKTAADTVVLTLADNVAGAFTPAVNANVVDPLVGTIITKKTAATTTVRCTYTTTDAPIAGTVITVHALWRPLSGDGNLTAI